jgi:hypothetical protein
LISLGFPFSDYAIWLDPNMIPQHFYDEKPARPAFADSKLRPARFWKYWRQNTIETQFWAVVRCLCDIQLEEWLSDTAERDSHFQRRMARIAIGCSLLRLHFMLSTCQCVK